LEGGSDDEKDKNTREAVDAGDIELEEVKVEEQRNSALDRPSDLGLRNVMSDFSNG
jgi:hypothetical protein